MKLNHQFGNKNYYEILELKKDCNDEEIKSSFKKLAKKYHPDLNKENIYATANFQILNEAYNTLIDSKKRKDYDYWLNNKKSNNEQNFKQEDYAYEEDGWFINVYEEITNAIWYIKKFYTFSSNIEYFEILDSFYFLNEENQYLNIFNNKPITNAQNFYLSFYYDKNYKRHFKIWHENKNIPIEIKRLIMNRFKLEENKFISGLNQIKYDRFTYKNKILYQLFDEPIKIRNKNFIKRSYSNHYEYVNNPQGNELVKENIAIKVLKIIGISLIIVIYILWVIFKSIFDGKKK